MKYLLIFLPVLFFVSCQDVITLDLDTSEQKVVIEANLDGTNGICTVSLSKSSDFYETSDFQKISDANIQIETAQGDFHFLAYQGNGLYKTAGIFISPGDSINLKIVLADNKEFFANAIAPNLVTLDDIKLVKSSINRPFGNDDGEYDLFIEWKDASDEENYNRMKVYRNNEYLSKFYVLFSDEVQNGKDISMPLMGQRFAIGDTVKVALLSCNKSYYDYFSDISKSAGRGFSSVTPFNPMGNVDNGALGYFGVWYVSELEKIVE